jgi:hypothetical protein
LTGLVCLVKGRGELLGLELCWWLKGGISDHLAETLTLWVRKEVFVWIFRRALKGNRELGKERSGSLDMIWEECVELEKEQRERGTRKLRSSVSMYLREERLLGAGHNLDANGSTQTLKNLHIRRRMT